MKRVLLMSVASLGLMLAMSCKKEEETVVGPAACQLAADRVAAYERAVTNYAASQTPANCKAFVDAANSFLDAAKNCSTVSAQDVKEARDAIAAVKC
jgi:hypothetical protein